MLYEMVTGRPPFMGDDDIAIIGQHINTPPVAPSWHRTDCPKPLDALIMRLLAKDPSQRPDSAADVLSALQAVDFSSLPSPRSGRGEDEGEGTKGRSLDSVSSGVFVGRQKEMDQLRAMLEETLSGHGRMVTLVGEPGIGKTRTAQELATYAGLRRSQVLWGRCYEGGGAPPYWPWVQAIRSYVLERDPVDLRREMGSTASVIAEVVTDVKERLPGLQPPPPLESPESARFRLFDSITAFFKSASKSQSLVVVLDDLHWSDKPSLLLLEFVARELANSRILVVGTYRDMELNRKHPLAITLGDLTRERLFEKVLLRGLQKHDVERFIELAAGVKPPSGLVDAVQTQTEGNPLFVTEVVRLLVQDGHLTAEKMKGQADAGSSPRQKTTTWTVRIPEGIREVIGRRLDRLSDRCNDVLTTAAVIERRFSLAALVKLYSDPLLPTEERLSEDRLLELMEEALAARIIEELPSGPGRFMFTHALMQETLTSELSATRKVRLHARIAVALEGLFGDRAEDHAAELAAHFGEAESLPGSDKLIKYSLIAGNQALTSCAYEDAARHFQRGLGAMRIGAADSSPLTNDSAGLLLGMARAIAPSASFEGMRPVAAMINRGFDYLVATGQTQKAIRLVADRYSFLLSWHLQDTLERALKLVPVGSQEHVLLLAQTVAPRMIVDRQTDQMAVARVAEAVELADKLGDPYAIAAARYAACLVAIWSLDVPEAVRQGQIAVAKAAESGRTYVQLGALFWLGNSHRAAGEPDKAHSLHCQALDIGEKLRDQFWIGASRLGKATTYAATGEWKLARENLGVQSRGRFGERVSIDVEAQTGNFEAGRRRIEVISANDIEFYTDSPENEMIFAEIYLANMEGSRPPPLPETLGLLPEDFPVGRRHLKIPRAIAVADTQDRSRVAAAYRLLAPHKGMMWLFGGSSSDRVLGRLAVLEGDFHRASRHFDEALAFLRRAGYRPELAWTSSDYSEMLLERASTSTAADSQGAGSADRAKAVKLQDEALSIARDLGMKPLVERVIARKKILKA
jgi:tetratricopeptide (TPR) repeat protein